jgi:type IV pilus assembly protein PilF
MKTIEQNPVFSKFASALLVVFGVAFLSACGSTGGTQNNNQQGSVKTTTPPAVGDRFQGAQKSAQGGSNQPYQPDLQEIGKLNLRLASAYYSAGQFKTAEEVIAIPLEVNPKDVTVLGLAALIQVELRNKTRAKEYFDRAFKLEPKNPDLNHNYGVYLCRNNDPVAAMEFFKVALAAEGYQKPGSTLSAGADCLAKIGRDEEAIQYYTGALRFEPMNPNALIGLASLQYRRGSVNESNELMNRYARVAQSTSESLWLQLRIARKMGLKEDERGFAADLRRSYPGSMQTQALDQGRYD